MSTVIVTGASRGIGKGIARRAASEGWSVVVNHSSSAKAAQEVAEEIRDGGGQAIAAAADVTDEAAVSEMMERAQNDLGPIKALVNNAGTMGSNGPVDEMDAAATRRMLDVNLVGPFLCSKQAIRRMSTRHGGEGGVIVNISGQAALHGGVGSYIDLAVSKAAVDMLTRALAQEQGPGGVRVNGVRPGVIMTEGAQEWEDANPGWAAGIIDETPLGRVGEVEDIAAAVLWLMSDEAVFVSGEVMTVNGAYVTAQA